MNAVQKTCPSRLGNVSDEGPSDTWPERVAITIAPTPTSTSEIGCLRSASASATTANASAISQPELRVWSTKLFGVSDTSFHEIFRNSSPTVSCTPRISARGKARAA